MYKTQTMVTQITERQKDKKTLDDGLKEIRSFLQIYADSFFEPVDVQVIKEGNYFTLQANLQKEKTVFVLRVVISYSQSKFMDVTYKSHVNNYEFATQPTQSFAEVKDVLNSVDEFVNLFCDSMAKRFTDWSR